jgi:hypothetical protein
MLFEASSWMTSSKPMYFCSPHWQASFLLKTASFLSETASFLSESASFPCSGLFGSKKSYSCRLKLGPFELCPKTQH